MTVCFNHTDILLEMNAKFEYNRNMEIMSIELIMEMLRNLIHMYEGEEHRIFICIRELVKMRMLKNKKQEAASKGYNYFSYFSNFKILILLKY